MNYARLIQAVLLRIMRTAAQRYEEALKPLGHALHAFLAVLFQQRPFPAEWRGYWKAFLAVQRADYFIEQESADEVEHWIEWRAKRLGLLPDEPAVSTAATSSAEYASTATTPQEQAEFKKWMQGPSPNELDPNNPTIAKTMFADVDGDANVAAIMWLIRHPEEAHPRILRVKELKGLWTDYDRAVERGEGPNVFMRALWGVVRTALPSSEPSRAYFLDDGTIYVELSGGPTSGALGGQGTALLTGLNARSLGEDLIDGLFQEVTGSPIGPSVAKGLKSPKGSKPIRQGGSESIPSNPKTAETAKQTDDPSRVQSNSSIGRNKIAGDSTRDTIASREALAIVEWTAKTVGGIRRVDVLKIGDELTAIESKVGRTSLDSNVRRELARDWWLRRQGQVGRVIWEFAE